ncbi:MAG: response regulator transcription factor [Bacteroidia bacterium]
MGRKILIVDDEPDMRSLLKRVLTAHDYSVEEAENIQQGISRFKATFPDIVMLDVNLPDGNGVHYINEFKNDNNIVFLMSADNDHLKEGFREMGVNGFIKKPFVLDELLEIIGKQNNVSS